MKTSASISHLRDGLHHVVHLLRLQLPVARFVKDTDEHARHGAVVARVLGEAALLRRLGEALAKVGARREPEVKVRQNVLAAER